ncbi:hypothetical protein B0A50_00189 [Salinomyces thailandicus]|uniref:Uncharacterized protein n=1 Tax=Salinomyces thailandicus TaxID=706561 RepID=A0A4V5N7X2_9PEZI|nr:hypothetical protein B0A50_00189 [Salinomyces thailandica]
MHMKDTQLEDESGRKDQFDPIVEEFDSEPESEQHPILPGLPTDEHGAVPSDLTIRIRRSAKGREPRGLIFTADSPEGPQQVMFGEPRNWTSDSSSEEVVFFRGAKSDTSAIGSVDFHRWLKDQSDPIAIRHGGGNETDLRRTGKFTNEHGFVLGDRRFSWRRSKEAGGITKWHYECVDETESQYAFYMSEKVEGRSGSERNVGRFEVRRKGLKPETVEALLMSEIALFVKLQKKSQGGGLAAAAQYALQ